MMVSLNAAPHAVGQGSQGDTEVAATLTVPAECFVQHAPTVVKIPKYPLNLVLVDVYIVAIATVKSD